SAYGHPPVGCIHPHKDARQAAAVQRESRSPFSPRLFMPARLCTGLDVFDVGIKLLPLPPVSAERRTSDKRPVRLLLVHRLVKTVGPTGFDELFATHEAQFTIRYIV